MADVAHVEQQELGQSLASLWNALGAVAGFLASAWIDPVVNIRLFLGIASTLVAATTAIACVSVKERALGEAEEEAQPALVAAPGPEASKAVSTYEAAAEAFRNMGRGVCAMPKGMRRLCLLQFLTWGAWFTYNPYWASWAGSYLYSGTAPGVPTCAANGTLIHPSSASTHAEHLYRDGTSLAGFAQASAAGLQLLFSFAAPTLSRVVGLRVTYAASFVVLVAALGGLGALPPVHRLSASKPLAFALMAATGIPLAATNIFPFSIIGRIYPSDPNLALYSACRALAALANPLTHPSLPPSGRYERIHRPAAAAGHHVHGGARHRHLLPLGSRHGGGVGGARAGRHLRHPHRAGERGRGRAEGQAQAQLAGGGRRRGGPRRLHAPR